MVAVARATGLFFQTPSQQLSSLFHLWECSTFVLGMAHPWWRLWRREPPPSPCCALSLQCSCALSLLSLIYICYKLVFGTPCCNLAKQGAMGTLLSGEECPSPPAAVEGAGGAGSTPQGGLHPCGGQGCSPAQLLCRGPSQPWEVPLARVQQPSARAVSEQPGCAGELT